MSTWKFEKHLHVRGENIHSRGSLTAKRETPPRAWRKRWQELQLQEAERNTSTCVEKTCIIEMRLMLCRETPPRAWRKHIALEGKLGTARNTSTCVEKTHKSRKGAFIP